MSFILLDMSQLRALVSSISRRAVAAVAGVAVAATVMVAPASAQQLPDLDQLSSQAVLPEVALPDMSSGIDTQLRDQAWIARNQINSQASLALNEAQARQVAGMVDAAVEAAFPGLIAERTAPAPAPASAPAPAARPRPANNPCPPSARACVDLAGERTWLQRNGKITYGPVPHSPGASHTPTPKGTFYVNRKVKDEISYEFGNAPMPYAVYFTNNGHAFHQGGLHVRSAGCVRLNHADAVHYFNNLQIGDQVYIW